jgi:glycosyltransferase involved in cell wall biosynthesis
MKILAYPRDDQNPYQRLLYGELRRHGAQVSYLGQLTSSHTLNLLLLPAELVAHRAAGARLVHIHWLYRFGLPWAASFPVLRWLSQAWLAIWLRTARLLGLRLVWTAHNVLPHTQVFADDARARRKLVAACALVLVHSEATLTELAALGAVPRRSAVIPHGPLVPSRPAVSLRTPGSGDGPRQFLFFGQVLEYKGVEDLLAAFTALPDGEAARLTVAGQCHDPQLRSRLDTLARGCGERVALRLGRVPEEKVTPLLAAADVVVLPYRRITTSGTAMLALAHGRPLIVPDVAPLTDLPRQAIVSYDRTRPGLVTALTQLARADSSALAEMSAAARACASALSWQDIAARTMSEMARVLGGAPRADASPGLSQGRARCG